MKMGLKILILTVVTIVAVGCGKTSVNIEVNEEINKDTKSVAVMKDGFLWYPDRDTLYKEMANGIMPNGEEFTDMKLESINDGVAEFSRHIKDNRYEAISFIITPELRQYIDNEGVYYHTEGKLLYPEYLSTMTVEGHLYVYIVEENTTVSCITNIVEIDKVEHNLTSEDLEIKTYDTIEKIDEGIRSGEINSGGIFTMESYKILDEHTILATYSGSSETKELGVTPFIVEQLIKSEDESFRVEYKEINGKDYIIGLTK